MVAKRKNRVEYVTLQMKSPEESSFKYASMYLLASMIVNHINEKKKIKDSQYMSDLFMDWLLQGNEPEEIIWEIIQSYSKNVWDILPAYASISAFSRDMIKSTITVSEEIQK